MARLGPHDPFDPGHAGRPVVGIQADLAAHDSGVHRHAMGQVLFARHGCMRITLRSPPQVSLLPPTRAAWIPAGVPHRVQLQDVVGYRSVYLDPLHFAQLPAQCQIVQVAPLLRELLERISELPLDTAWDGPAEAALATLCVAELCRAPAEPLMLPLPRDRRLARALSGRELPPPLSVLAQRAGASERTLARIVQRETGMGYQQWRQQWRCLRAAELLSLQRPLAEVAAATGFHSESAFSAFFQQHFGTRPAQWRRQRLGSTG